MTLADAYFYGNNIHDIVTKQGATANGGVGFYVEKFYDTIVKNNVFDCAGIYDLRTDYCKDSLISGNSFISKTSASGTYHIVLQHCDDGVVCDNLFDGTKIPVYAPNSTNTDVISNILNGSSKTVSFGNNSTNCKKVKNNIQYIDISESVSSGTDWTYTGVSVTIPANSIFAVCASTAFSNSNPTGLALLKSSTTFSAAYALDIAETDRTRNVSFCGKTSSDSITIYVWAKVQVVSGTNPINLHGFYEN
jgi:hypothetical protein